MDSSDLCGELHETVDGPIFHTSSVFVLDANGLQDKSKHFVNLHCSTPSPDSFGTRGCYVHFELATEGVLDGYTLEDSAFGVCYGADVPTIGSLSKLGYNVYCGKDELTVMLIPPHECEQNPILHLTSTGKPKFGVLVARLNREGQSNSGDSWTAIAFPNTLFPVFKTATSLPKFVFFAKAKKNV